MITSEELNKYIRKIGGLENGFTPWPHKDQTLKYCSFVLLRDLRVPDNKNPFRRKIYSVGCPDGWNLLVKNLIQELIDNGWNRELCQCKEKFGGLRFYINGASKECHDIISKYENLSYETCERCGNPGQPNDTGWITTLCDECRNKQKEKFIKL